MALVGGWSLRSSRKAGHRKGWGRETRWVCLTTAATILFWVAARVGPPARIEVGLPNIPVFLDSYPTVTQVRSCARAKTLTQFLESNLNDRRVCLRFQVPPACPKASACMFGCRDSHSTPRKSALAKMAVVYLFASLSESVQLPSICRCKVTLIGVLCLATSLSFSGVERLEICCDAHLTSMQVGSYTRL